MSRMSMCCAGFVLFSLALALAGCGAATDGLEPSPGRPGVRNGVLHRIWFGSATLGR
jgi:hypothetical protein